MAKSTNTSGQDNVKKLFLRNLSPKRVWALLRRGVTSMVNSGWQVTFRKVAFRACVALKRPYWRFVSDRPTNKELRLQRRAQFKAMPQVSILVPLYNTPPEFLHDMLKSCIEQTYPNWQLCLADASGTGTVGAIVKTYKDKRIVYKKLSKNLGIAGNTNAAAALASGSYMALLDHDDILYPNALYEMVKAINATGAQLLYSDEVVLSEDLKEVKGYHFKPCFAPDYLRGCNYITHLCMFETALFNAVGGQRPEYDGAQDYDLILRLSEKAGGICHVPKLLYIWRAHAASTASEAAAKPYAVQAGVRAITAHLARVGLAGEAVAISAAGSYRVKYKLCATPLVSVIIPNKDHVTDLRLCLESFYKFAGYENFEVVVVENNSQDVATESFYKEAAGTYKNLSVVRYQGPFNFSAICNFGAEAAKGEYILLLNNDIEITSEGFLEEMLSFAQRGDVGAVGAKLEYPDGLLQHGGVFVGIGGSAGHSHKGALKNDMGDMFRLGVAGNFTAVTGACLLTKTSLYRKVGGLDETKFAVAYNDIDYCLRLWQAGYINVYTPFAVATHYESKSRGYEEGSDAYARYQRERSAFKEKYAAMFETGDPYYNPHLTLEDQTYAFENYCYCAGATGTLFTATPAGVLRHNGQGGKEI